MPSDREADLHERLGAAQQRRAEARTAGDVAARILACRDCGDAHFAIGDTDLPFARKLFAEAMTLIEESGVHREFLPELLGMTGRTLQRLKRWDQVLSWYRRAAEEAERQGLAAQQLRWRLKEATTLMDMGDADNGRARLDEVVALGRSMRANGHAVDEPLADALQRLANFAGTDEDVATALWDEVGTLLAAVPAGRAHYLHAMNRAAWHAGHDRQSIARTFIEEALEISRAAGFEEQERIELGLRLAALIRKEHEPVQAGDSLMVLLADCHAERLRHEVLKDAVDAYHDGHAWSQMLGAAEQLRDLRRRTLGPGWQYDAAMRCSVAHRGLKNHDAALALLREARGLAQACSKPEWVADARAQTAIVMVDARHFADAAQLGESLWIDGDRRPLTVRTLVRALIGAGDLDRAEAITAAFGAGGAEELEVARLRALLADAGRGDAGTAWYAVGVAASRQPRIEAEALTHLLAVTPSGPDRFEQARHRLRVLDRARAVVNVFSDASWQATFEDAEQLPGWLDTFVTEALRGDQDEAAFYEIERFRAQTLVNLLSERRMAWSAAEMRRGWFKAVTTARLQRERHRLRALAARGVGWRERRAAAEEVARLEVAALSAEGLIHFGPADQGINFPQDLEALLGEHRLADGECLVCAHALPGGLALWAKLANGTMQRTMLSGLGRDAVDRMGRTLRTIGQLDAIPDIAALLGELDACCGRPLAAWLASLGVHRAFLSVGTAVAGLPIDCCAALLSPGSPEIALLPSSAALGFVRGHRTPATALFHVTSADRARASRARMKESRGHVLLVVDPSHDLDFAPLEGAVVASLYRARQRQLNVIDRAGIDPKALARACEAADVLHFVGHGDFDDSDPYRSGLTIAPAGSADALWTNGDIFGDVDAPAARLAVLSGCETGHTMPNLVSEEVSLPAAFIAAGYAAVVASRWAVDDLSATLMMANFHERWSAGRTSVASALAASQRWLRDLGRDEARAQVTGLADQVAAATSARAASCQHLCEDALALLDEDGGYPFADPLYWAAFFVSGDGSLTADGIDPRVA